MTDETSIQRPLPFASDAQLLAMGYIQLQPSSPYYTGSDGWTPVGSSGAPSARESHTAVWTGTEMIVWGGIAAGVETDTGARYDPSGDTWTSISTTGAPSARTDHTAVWTGTEMIVWGGIAAGVETDTGARYEPRYENY